MVEARANRENGGLPHFEASVRNDVFLFLETRKFCKRAITLFGGAGSDARKTCRKR